MTLKEIIAIMLGFMTPLLVVGLGISLFHGIEYIGTFDLPSTKYWTGFFLFAGLAVTGWCCFLVSPWG